MDARYEVRRVPGQVVGFDYVILDTKHRETLLYSDDESEMNTLAARLNQHNWAKQPVTRPAPPDESESE